jgi:hypothetical protein
MFLLNVANLVERWVNKWLKQKKHQIHDQCHIKKPPIILQHKWKCKKED